MFILNQRIKLYKFVGVPGLEPGKAGPESAVLPLHHTPIKHKKWSVSGSIALEYGCKSSTLLQTRQILRRFFSNNLSNGYPEQAVMSRCPKLVRYKMVPYPHQWTNYFFLPHSPRVMRSATNANSIRKKGHKNKSAAKETLRHCTLQKKCATCTQIFVPYTSAPL